MTFCLGIRVREGLVAVADTRISVGSQKQMARKITVIQDGMDEIVLMTSGLRSLRDKVFTYFEKALHDHQVGFDNLYQAVNVLADQLRRVAAEDKAALAESDLAFDLHCLIGGKLTADRDHKLYMLYPQANWVEITEGTPYCILGETSYGKPLLDRVLNHESSLEVALNAALLAFEATQSSTSGVGYPMDAVILRPGEPMQATQFPRKQVAGVAEGFDRNLRTLVESMPTEWMGPLLGAQGTTNVTSITTKLE